MTPALRTSGTLTSVKAGVDRDPLWIRISRLLEPVPGWVFWLGGYLVLVPFGYWLGASGINGDVASSPGAGRVGAAIAMAIGWTALAFFHRKSN
jgi:hypothetical protein